MNIVELFQIMNHYKYLKYESKYYRFTSEPKKLTLEFTNVYDDTKIRLKLTEILNKGKAI